MNIMYLLYNRKNFYGGWIGRRGPNEWPPRCPQIYSMSGVVGLDQRRSLPIKTQNA